MWLEWILLSFLVILPIAAGKSGIRKRLLHPPNRSRFYLKDIIISVVILVAIFVAQPSAYDPLNFYSMGKGIYISDDILASVMIVFLVPFVLSFTRWSTDYPKDISSAKELFGYPVSYLPNSVREYFLFFCYLVVGVFYEELTCRQFLFRALHITLRLNGDLLVIVSSLLFSIGHLYQGWKGMLSSFILGLAFGKIFLSKETLAYPLVLHLFINLTMVVLAFRRLKDLKKIRRVSRDVTTTG